MSVLVICVLVFTVFCIVCTVFFYCFVYVYLFLYVLPCRLKSKATDTHSQYVVLTVFPPQQRLHERAVMLRVYVHCVSCYNIIINLTHLSTFV